MKQTELFLGLDVHKDCITAAGAEGGRDGEVRHLGSIANDLHALERLIAKLRGPAKRPLQVCYEAGPCGLSSPAGSNSWDRVLGRRALAHPAQTGRSDQD